MVMPMVQVKCPETGRPVDIGDVPREANIALSLWSRPIACPHCGKDHPWSSGHFGLAMKTLHDFPDATRVLVDGDSAIALS
jgi:endogenous inhibitor of DNA gyrase (YacG/DUF329 family)